MFAAIQYFVDENQDVTLGDLVLYPETDMTATDVTEDYGKILTLAQSTIDYAWLESKSEAAPLNNWWATINYYEKYSYSNSVVTKLDPIIIIGTVMPNPDDNFC